MTERTHDSTAQRSHHERIGQALRPTGGGILSIDFRPLGPIRMIDLFDGRLEMQGFNEHICDETSPTARCLRSCFYYGGHYMWVYGTDDSMVSGLSCYGTNRPYPAIGIISTEYCTPIVSQDEPQFWGFDSWEDWFIARERAATENQNNFYDELGKHFAGEACRLESNPVWAAWAGIAKRLVRQAPELVTPANKALLLRRIKAVCRFDSITLADVGAWRPQGPRTET